MAGLVSNPYGDVDWRRVGPHLAQFHTHTSAPETDGHTGQDAPEVVVDDYHEAGYSVLVLNEHEYNVETTTWPWTTFDRDPTALGMVGIEGAELGDTEGVSHDILSLYADIVDSSGLSVSETLAAIGERSGLAIFAHPGRYHSPAEADWYVGYFERFPHLLGLEVFNADDRYPGDRELWDRVQTELGSTRSVWAFADDDYHGRDADYTFDRSRNVLFLSELTDEAVRTAIEDGRFVYQHAAAGETPPELEAVEHDETEGVLELDAEGYDAVEWVSEGDVVTESERLAYRDADVGCYARARLTTADGSETGTQPFLFD